MGGLTVGITEETLHGMQVLRAQPCLVGLCGNHSVVERRPGKGLALFLETNARNLPYCLFIYK